MAERAVARVHGSRCGGRACLDRIGGHARDGGRVSAGVWCGEVARATRRETRELNVGSTTSLASEPFGYAGPSTGSANEAHRDPRVCGRASCPLLRHICRRLWPMPDCFPGWPRGPVSRCSYVVSRAAAVLPFSVLAAVWLPFLHEAPVVELWGGAVRLSVSGLWLFAGVVMKSLARDRRGHPAGRDHAIPCVGRRPAETGCARDPRRYADADVSLLVRADRRSQPTAPCSGRAGIDRAGWDRHC